MVSVYRLPKLAPSFLYLLLQERKPYMNISHHVMPSWKRHIKFIGCRPYSCWYLIRLGTEYVGAIYLTGLDEIGISVLARWRGFDVSRKRFAC